MRLAIPGLLLLAPLISQSQQLQKDSNRFAVTPGFTLHNPLSPGTLGTVVIAAVIQDKTRLARQVDGNAEVYIGLGQPEKAIGGGIAINLHGLTNGKGEKDNLGEGTASFHVNRLIQKKLLVDVGIDNAFSWGGLKPNREYITYQKSVYVSMNYLFKIGQQRTGNPFSYISLTAGAGNGYYRMDKDYSSSNSGNLNPFISVAVPVLPRTTFISEWNGYDLGFGLSSFPLKQIPVMLRSGVTDLVFGRPRYMVSISLAFQFYKGFQQQPDRPLPTKMIRPARTI